MSNNEAKRLLVTCEECEEKIIFYKKKIEELQQKMKETRGELWKSCIHVWTRSYDVVFDDPCKYYCVHCSLWKDPVYI